MWWCVVVWGLALAAAPPSEQPSPTPESGVSINILDAELTLQTVHDRVMGGRSTGTVARSDNGLVFAGELSLEDNGGFASLRAGNVPSLAGTGGLRLEVLGDGRTWQVTVSRSDVAIPAGSYRAYIDTVAGELTEHTLLWDDFTAVAYGRPVSGAPPLGQAPGRIDRVGLLLADKTPGPFAITWVSAEPLPAPEDTPPPPPRQQVDNALLAAIRAGVPAFNAGRPDVCAAHYQTALESVILLRPDALTPAEQRLVQQALATARREDATTAAWTLRRAIDTLLRGA